MKSVKSNPVWKGLRGQCQFCHREFVLGEKDKPVQHEGEHGLEYLMSCPKCKFGVVVCRKKTKA